MRGVLWYHNTPRCSFYQVYLIWQLLSVLHCLEAGTAIYRSVTGRLENNLCLTAAVCTYSRVVFTRSSSCVLLCITASLATLGLVHKALFLEESLLTCGEYELFAAFLANKCLVYKFFSVHSVSYYFFVHDFTSLCKMVLPCIFPANGKAEIGYLIRDPPYHSWIIIGATFATFSGYGILRYSPIVRLSACEGQFP